MLPRFISVGKLAVVGWFALTAFAVPTKSPRSDDLELNRKRADGVKEAFLHAWGGYYKYAFPHDELKSVTNQSSDSR